MPSQPLSSAVKLEPLGDKRARAIAIDPGARMQLSWDRYVQLSSLAAACQRATSLSADKSICDIGSTDGALCLFLPQAELHIISCDTANGGSFDLAEQSFDLVVACGVLEQIEPRRRGVFIATMARACRVACVVNFALPSSSTAQKVVSGITGDPIVSRQVGLGLPYSATVQKQFEDIGFTCQSQRHTSQAVWAVFSALKFAGPESSCDIGRYLIEEHTNPAAPPDDPLYETITAWRSQAPSA